MKKLMIFCFVAACACFSCTDSEEDQIRPQFTAEQGVQSDERGDEQTGENQLVDVGEEGYVGSYADGQ